MIKKLRVKFTVISVTATAIVLTVILGTVCFLNYKHAVREADDLLEMLAENHGIFPMHPEEREKRKRPMYKLSPEAPFETRYFSVWISEDGKILDKDMGKIAAVDNQKAGAYALQVMQSKKNRGFIKEYRYINRKEYPGNMIIFLDCSRSLSGVRRFFLISCAVEMTGIIAVLVLVILLSDKITRPVAESYEKQKRFITDAGHEIKTPLAVIAADAEILRMENGENEWITDIEKQVFRLRDLTDDLIFLSKMEEGQKNMERAEFSLSETVQEIVHSFSAMARVQKKIFHLEIDPMISYQGDVRAIQKLLTILLDNAFKYSEEQGKIFLVLKKGKRGTEILVENTTTHMDKDTVKHLFDRFYRADCSRNTQTGGYGIGLSIAKAIVDAHGGKISASVGQKSSLCIRVSL